MPCNTVILNSVDLENANMNHDLLMKALVALYGESVTRRAWEQTTLIFTVNGREVTLRNGQLTSSLSATQLQEVTGKIKQAYSKEVVKYAAKRFGWAVKFESADPYAFTATKS